jgi:hypothetical protein
MSIPLSGTIGLQAVKTELSVSPSTFSLKSAEQGTYVSLNACSTYKPDGAANFSLSEWYGYNHTQACVTPTAYPRILSTTYDFLEAYDGGVIAVGDFSAYTANGSTTYKDRIFKFDSQYLGHAGDFGVGVSTQFNGTVKAISENSDGSLVAVGNFSNYQGVTLNRIVKLTSGGLIDPYEPFNPNTGVGFTGEQLYFGYTQTPNVQCVTISSIDNGKILVGGNFYGYNGWSVENICRLNANGSIDYVFSSNCRLGRTGSSYNPTVYSIRYSSSSIYIVGNFSPTASGSIIYHGIIRVNLNGTTDYGFNPNGCSFAYGTGADPYQSYTVKKVEVRSDSKVIIGGVFTKYLRGGTLVASPNYILALNSDGSVASTFSGGLNGEINDLGVYSDDKIIFGGNFNLSPLGYSVKGIIRYNSDFTIDTSFMANIGSGPARTNPAEQVYVTSLQILHTGQVILHGNWQSWNGNTNMQGIALLNYDGTLVWS